MKNTIIRKAEQADLDRVYELICELEQTVLDKDVFTQIYDRQISDCHYLLIVVQLNQLVVGFLSLQIKEHLHHAAKIAEIIELVIHESSRGQRIGDSLFQAGKKFAKENNCSQLELCTNVRRLRAHQFYEKQGMNKSHHCFTLTL
ncbi:GNAT family N-acetyltransferase [Dysgonomonas sp. HDW5B]|uniref:GNAT family N-acetyltransferase n=1 Tax=Dysgonomonas sp. HDW5B TaxID=2714927 RepID=UPI001407A7BC|nr:GNAT family N-acetyltransferase [Dysgonomonas sp. HDW5B]QIK53716.1 GNAT family N-acetyltransferase [Dysgonomonas sp. HDW5B]